MNNGHNPALMSPAEQAFRDITSTAMQNALQCLAPGYKAVFFFLKEGGQHDIVVGTGSLDDVLSAISKKVPAEKFAEFAKTKEDQAADKLMTRQLEVVHGAIRRAMPFLDGAGGKVAKGILQKALQGVSDNDDTRGEIIRLLLDAVVRRPHIELLMAEAFAGYADGQVTDGEFLEDLHAWRNEAHGYAPTADQPRQCTECNAEICEPPGAACPVCGREPRFICRAGHAADEMRGYCTCGAEIIEYKLGSPFGL